MSANANEDLLQQVSSNSFKGSKSDNPLDKSADSKMKKKSSRGNILKVRSNSSRIDGNL